MEYIQKDVKTKNKLYCTSMNVSLDPKLAIEQFKSVQKMYDRENYQKTNKKNIIAHSFTQSFHKDENVTPELAMTIAMETAEKHFGKDFQILISTHVDKEHIHSHFIVNSVSMTGEKYHSQGNTLSAFRKISDEVCKSYGLDVLDYSKHKKRKRTLTYNRWKEKQKGISWKDRIKIDIDKSIIKSSSTSELLVELSKLNYECKYFTNASGEKYLGIRDTKFKKTYFANTKNFGEGYDLKSLEEKINNKDLVKLPNEVEINNTLNNSIDVKKAIRIKVYKEKNIQLKYRSTIDILIDLIVNRNVIKPVKYYKQYPYSVKNDYHVQMLSNQLQFIRSKGIKSYDDFENAKNKMQKSYDDLTVKVNKLVKMKATHKNLVKEFETFEILQNKKVASERNRNTNVESGFSERKLLKVTTDELNLLRTLEDKLQEFDLNKIKDNLVILEDNIEKIKEVFKEYGKDVRMFEEIETTLEDIENESYINNAKISSKRDDESFDKENKSNEDIERR